VKAWTASVRKAGDTFFRVGWPGLVLAVLTIVLAAGMAGVEWSHSPVFAGGPARVIASFVTQGPVLDGVVESLWDAADPVCVPLKRGRHGSETAYEAELRTIYTADDIYFMVRWPDSAPAAPSWSEQNKLILHFSVPAPWQGADDLMCLTACHTAYVDDQDRGRYVTAETIPPGLTDPLALGGGWQDGYWMLEWGRPLESGNPFDVQFGDLATSYRFFVKVVEGRSNEPDPISDDLLLGFQVAP